MTLDRTITLTRRVIRQLAADRRTLALIIFVPLIILTIAGFLMRADTTNFTVAVVMQDEGTSIPLRSDVNLGETLTDNLQTVNEAVHVLTLEAAEAQAALDRGDIDAIITVPADFSERTASTRELYFPVEYEGSNPAVTQILKGLLTQAAVRSLASLNVLSAQTTTLPTVTIDATFRYGGETFDSLDYFAPVLIGLFEFMFVFILASVSFLRERTAGTLERLQATPIRNPEIVVGYLLGFSIFALLQSLVILAYTIFGLQVHYNGSLLLVFAVEALLALMAVNLGIFFSTFARNEFQVVQFIPLVVVTQMFLSGALWAIEDMPAWLQPIAQLMPLTYANEALRNVMIKGFGASEIMPQVLILAGFTVLLILLSTVTIQRQARR